METMPRLICKDLRVPFKQTDTGPEARIRVIKRHKDSKMAGDTLFSAAHRELISFFDFLGCPSPF